jgi:hypothetical protein
MAPKFFSVRWHGEAFHGLGVQSIDGLILVGLYLCLKEEREEKERKNEKRIEKMKRG